MGALNEVVMNIWEDSHPKDDQMKWSEWTMHPKKQPVKLEHYTSAIVLVTSAIYVMGFVGA